MNKADYFKQESTHLYYRSLELADEAAWSNFFVNNDRLRFLGIEASDRKPKELSKEFIHKQFGRYQEFGLGHLAVCKKENDELIGVAGILAKSIDNTLRYEVAYSLLPKHWGKGYATEMAQQMKHFGFEQLKLTSMISIIHLENYDSAKVAIKNGMTIWKNTSYRDMDVQIYKINNQIKSKAENKIA